MAIHQTARTMLKLTFISPQSHLQNLHTKLPKILIFTFTHIHTQTSTSTLPKNPILFNYLTNSLNLPKPKALSISNRFSLIKTIEKPEKVVSYFKILGFSDTQIQSTIIMSPQILFADVEKTLKPKVRLFQDLGISGFRLGKFMSKNSSLLTRSLTNRLRPCIDVINSVLGDVNGNGEDGNDLVRVLSRCNWVAARDPEITLLSNVSYLKSCGIVGSQLAMLLIRQPRIFALSESEIRSLIGTVVDMGFSVDSRMFVHGLHTVSCISKDTFAKKFELFREFGFSESECMEMFRTTPGLLRTSEDKLRFGLEFYLKTLGLKRLMLVKRPASLMYSMQDRVVPRYRVIEVMKSKGIMKKEPSYLTLFGLSEGDFLMRYISKYPDHAEELLIAYKGHLVSSSEE